jgi:hypothetical protein
VLALLVISHYSEPMSNTRHLAGSIASECICRNCVSPGSAWKQYVKVATRRSVRYSERQEIRAAIDSDNDHNADADYRVYMSRLTVQCVQNMRSIRD